MNNREQIDRAFNLLCRSFKYGGKLLICGNGGSAADCEHIVAELMKGMHYKRTIVLREPLQGTLPAISLCSHTALLTAIANDIGPEWVFAQQMFGWGKDGDVLLAISTSGKSQNVLKAIEIARGMLIMPIGLTGPYTELMERYCDVVISVPGQSAAEIQEGHIKIYHELCARLEAEFFL